MPMNKLIRDLVEQSSILEFQNANDAVPTLRGDESLVVYALNKFVDLLNNKFDVYERVAFEIRPAEYQPGFSAKDVEDLVTVYGRYAFSEITAAGGSGNRIKTHTAFTDIAFDNPKAELSGSYDVAELEKIILMLKGASDE